MAGPREDAESAPCESGGAAEDSGPEEGQGGAHASPADEGQKRPSSVAPAVLASSCHGVLALALGASIRVYVPSARSSDATQQPSGSPQGPEEGRVVVGYQGDAVRCLCFSPDGSWLASAGDDKMLCVWATPGHAHAGGQTLACLKKVRMPKRVSVLGFVDASWLLAADKYGQVHCVALPSPAQGSREEGGGEEVAEGREDASEAEGILGHCCSIITSMDVCASSRLVATADRDFKIRVSRLSPGATQGWASHDIQSFCLAHTAYVACVRFIGGKGTGRGLAREAEGGSAPEQPLLLLSGGGDGKMCLWDPFSGRLCHSLHLAPEQAQGSAGAVLSFEALQQGDRVTVAVVQQRPAEAALLILNCNLKQRTLQVLQRVELRAPPTSLAFVPPLGGARAAVETTTSAAAGGNPQQWPSLVLVSGGVPALPPSDAAVTPTLTAALAAQAKDVAQAAQACFQVLVPVPGTHPGVEGQQWAAEGRKLGTAEGKVRGLSGVIWQPVGPQTEGYADLEAAVCSLGAPLCGVARGQEAWEDAALAAREAGEAWHQELCKREYSLPEREFRKRKRNDRRGKTKV